MKMITIRILFCISIVLFVASAVPDATAYWPHRGKRKCARSPDGRWPQPECPHRCRYFSLFSYGMLYSQSYAPSSYLNSGQVFYARCLCCTRCSSLKSQTATGQKRFGLPDFVAVRAEKYLLLCSLSRIEWEFEQINSLFKMNRGFPGHEFNFYAKNLRMSLAIRLSFKVCIDNMQPMMGNILMSTFFKLK